MAAIPITDVLGTKVYLAAQGTAVTTPAEAAAAIAGGKEILNLIDLGTVTESRNVTDYTTIDGANSTKSAGSLTFSNFQLDVLYDSTDTAGQADMVTMWNNNERREIILEMSDDLAVSPSYVTFEIFLSSQAMEFAKEGAVKYMNTAEQSSKRVLIKATAA